MEGHAGVLRTARSAIRQSDALSQSRRRNIRRCLGEVRHARSEGFYAFTAVAADFNGDGWTDVYIACDSTPSLFFRNNKDGTFSEIATETGIAFNEHGFEQGGMGIAVGDYD